MKPWVYIIGSCVLVVAASAIGCRHTSDSSLERNFFRHESEFEALLAEVTGDEKLGMFGTDRLNYGNTRLFGGTTFSNSPDISKIERAGLSRERWERYQRQLRDLGLAQVSRGEGIVEFRVDQVSIFNGDSSKGYWHGSAEPGRRQSSLDRYRISEDDRNKFGGYLVSKPIKENW